MKRMGYKAPSEIYWTILELKGLLEDEESCVYFERHKKHIGMHPSHMRNVNSALREILNSKLNSYDPELDGLLLAYKNPTLLSPFAGILHDTCYIHMDIEADFYIFRPKVETKLKGIVNKVGINHIGVLVHKVFIASIPQPENEEDWPGNNVNMGQEIKFTVNQVDFSSKLPYIRGVLYEDEYLEGCKLFNNEFTESNYENNEITENNEIAENNESAESSDRKNVSFHEDLIADPSEVSARKRKRITFDSDSEEEEEEVTYKKPKKSSLNVANSQETENEKKPKKSSLNVVNSQETENEKKPKKSSLNVGNSQETENDKKPKKSSLNIVNSQETENDKKPKKSSLNVENSQETENDKKPKKSSLNVVNSQETENDSETEDQKRKIKKSHKKEKRAKKRIKIEHDSDEMESVLRKIKTEPCDDNVKVKKEPSKFVKYKIQKQETFD